MVKWVMTSSGLSSFLSVTLICPWHLQRVQQWIPASPTVDTFYSLGAGGGSGWSPFPLSPFQCSLRDLLLLESGHTLARPSSPWVVLMLTWWLNIKVLIPHKTQRIEQIKLLDICFKERSAESNSKHLEERPRWVSCYTFHSNRPNTPIFPLFLGATSR